MSKELNPIIIPDNFNYIAAFLTFSCQLRCVYCINHHGGDLVKGRWMNGEDWIRGLNRIKTREDLPITVQGGEPTTHKYFFNIVNEIDKTTSLDLLTNFEISEDDFISKVSPDRFKRTSPYASIRVSYHHKQSNFEKITQKVKKLQEKGYSIGIWEVDHPEYHSEVIYRQQVAHSMGIDYRLKEFLGPYNGKIYGTMKYQNAVNDRELRTCDCKTSELLIAPDGKIFRCTSDLYADRSHIGHILDPNFTADKLGRWQFCDVYGKCNSCDIKVKTNRFQEYGHSSVEIKNISKAYAPNQEYVEEVINTYGRSDNGRNTSI